MMLVAPFLGGEGDLSNFQLIQEGEGRGGSRFYLLLLLLFEERREGGFVQVFIVKRKEK